MAKSAYEYVKDFELDDRLLPGCWIVVRIDGKGFTRFCELHEFQKPNDARALCLMDDAAQEVMRLFADIRLAYGESDEYSFVFHPGTVVYKRRASKLVSLVTSCFSASYVRLWAGRFEGMALRATPVFDGRAVCYPTLRALRDYLAWRQVDTHVNNLYNTCFWALVGSGQTTAGAHRQLMGTLSDAKNELLFSQYGINYNDTAPQFRKGSVLLWVAEGGPPGPAVETAECGDVGKAAGFSAVQTIDEAGVMAVTEGATTCAEGSAGSSGRATEAQDAGSQSACGHPDAVANSAARCRRTSSAPRYGTRRSTKVRRRLTVMHVDIIKDEFWVQHPHLMA